MVYFYAIMRLSVADRLFFSSGAGRIVGLYFLPVFLTAFVGTLLHVWREALRYRFVAGLFCIIWPVFCLLLFAYISCVMSPCS